jgi:dUTP pyrophosphatase
LRCAETNIILYPDQSWLFHTGFIWEIPDGYCGIVKSRSGLAVKHAIEAYHGLIDSGYRGELRVQLTNRGNSPHTISTNDRIAQLVIVPVFTPELVVVDELTETTRQEGSFGSTGIE